MRLASAGLSAALVALAACTTVLGKFTAQERGGAGGSATASGTATSSSASGSASSSASSATSSSSVTGGGGAGGGGAQWTDMGVAQGFSITTFPQSYVAGSPLTIFLGSGTPNGSIFGTFDSQALKFSQQKAMPAGANDYCGCGLQATSVWSPYPSTALYVFGNYAQRFIDGTWLPIQGYIDLRGDAAGALLGAEVWIIGGRNPNMAPQDTVLSFDTKQQAFVPAGKYPKYVWGPVAGGCAASFNGKVYVFGGVVNLTEKNRAGVFDSATTAWAKLPDVPAAANECDAASSQGQVFVAVGHSAVWRYDIANNAWAKTFFLFPPGGKGWRLASAGGKVWAMGDMADGVHYFVLSAF